MNDLKKKNKKKIINLGFDVIGFTKPIVEKSPRTNSKNLLIKIIMEK